MNVAPVLIGGHEIWGREEIGRWPIHRVALHTMGGVRGLANNQVRLRARDLGLSLCSTSSSAE